MKKVEKGCLKWKRQTNKRLNLNQPKIRQESRKKEIQKKSKKKESSALSTPAPVILTRHSGLWSFFSVSQIWGAHLVCDAGRQKTGSGLQSEWLLTESAPEEGTGTAPPSGDLRA